MSGQRQEVREQALARAGRALGMELRAVEVRMTDDGRELAAVVGDGLRPRADRRGVAVHEIDVGVVVRDRASAVNPPAARTWFQPMCGTGKPWRSGNRVTRAGRMPRHSVSPSSLPANSSCMPRQMPSTGWVSVGMTAARPSECSRSMASAAAPTPGRITRRCATQLIRVGRQLRRNTEPVEREAQRGDVGAAVGDDRDVGHLKGRPCCSAVRCLRSAAPGAARGPCT